MLVDAVNIGIRLLIVAAELAEFARDKSGAIRAAEGFRFGVKNFHMFFFQFKQLII